MVHMQTGLQTNYTAARATRRVKLIWSAPEERTRRHQMDEPDSAGTALVKLENRLLTGDSVGEA